MKQLIALLALLCTAASPAVAAPRAPEDCAPKAIITGCGTQTASDFEGAIIVPGSAAANGEVARSGGCEGCRWTLVLNCDRNDVGGPGWVNCMSTHCPDGSRFRLYLQRPTDAHPVLLDTICLTSTRRIVTAAELAVDAEKYLTGLAPPATTIRVQPEREALTRTATFFVADGPATDATTLDVTTPAGPARLRIDIAPGEYRWEFGDGATCTTTSVGGPYDGDATSERCAERIAHVYTATGTLTARLRAVWQGTYTFDVGYGPVGPRAVPGAGVAGPVATRAVRVRQARAELIGR
jgi:hypothetical protein